MSWLRLHFRSFDILLRKVQKKVLKDVKKNSETPIKKV